uniref:GTPase n=1 Tax=Candidatus Karelsulcia muelleri TaxID=336810 RepID=UPI0032B30311
MYTQRENCINIIRVSLIGYTNVVKSSIMNALSKDKLFATLDTTVIKITIKDIKLILSYTVCFIRKLPTQLI